MNKDSRFKLTITHNERPSVIVPIRINGFVSNDGIYVRGIDSDTTIQKPLPAPEIDSEPVKTKE